MNYKLFKNSLVKVLKSDIFPDGNEYILVKKLIDDGEVWTSPNELREL